MSVNPVTAVAVHGLFGRSAPLVELLGAAGIRAVPADAQRHWAPNLREWSFAVKRALWGDCQDTQAPLIVAHSLGAYPALAAAQGHPDVRVILLNPTISVPGTLELAASLRLGALTVVSSSHDLVTGLRREPERLAAFAGARIVFSPHTTHSGFLPGIDEVWPAPVFFAERLLGLGRFGTLPLDHDRQRRHLVSLIRNLSGQVSSPVEFGAAA